MDIRFFNGDISEIDEGVIYHGVNCQGAMGSGVALALLRKHPVIRERYLALCKEFKHWKSDLLGTWQPVMVHPHLIIVNAFTQEFFGADGKRYASLDAINRSLRSLARKVSDVQTHPEYKIIHLPKVGGKRGGLDFDKEVMPLIERIAADYPAVTFAIWEYDGDN